MLDCDFAPRSTSYLQLCQRVYIARSAPLLCTPMADSEYALPWMVVANTDNWDCHPCLASSCLNSTAKCQETLRSHKSKSPRSTRSQMENQMKAPEYDRRQTSCWMANALKAIDTQPKCNLLQVLGDGGALSLSCTKYFQPFYLPRIQ